MGLQIMWYLRMDRGPKKMRVVVVVVVVVVVAITMIIMLSLTRRTPVVPNSAV